MEQREDKAAWEAATGDERFNLIKWCVQRCQMTYSEFASHFEGNACDNACISSAGSQRVDLATRRRSA